MDSLLAGVVSLVGYTGKVGIDASQDQVVVDFVEQVAEGGGVAAAGADQAGERGGQFLFDGLFKHRSAHHGAGSEETQEVATRRLIQTTVGFFGAGRGYYRSEEHTSEL